MIYVVADNLLSATGTVFPRSIRKHFNQAFKSVEVVYRGQRLRIHHRDKTINSDAALRAEDRLRRQDKKEPIDLTVFVGQYDQYEQKNSQGKRARKRVRKRGQKQGGRGEQDVQANSQSCGVSSPSSSTIISDLLYLPKPFLPGCHQRFLCQRSLTNCIQTPSTPLSIKKTIVNAMVLVSPIVNDIIDICLYYIETIMRAGMPTITLNLCATCLNSLIVKMPKEMKVKGKRGLWVRPFAYYTSIHL